MRPKKAAWLLLSIGITGLLAQLVMSLALWDRLTFEEIAESIRNPFWVSCGEIYDGISSNVVFYKALDLYYQIRGFDLFAAKEFRLLLTGVTLIAVCSVLWKYRREDSAAWLALLAYSLSPTLLYFGTFQASYGIDLQFFPAIGALWIWSLHQPATVSRIGLFVVIFTTVLLGASFPPGLFFLPAIILTDMLVLFSRWESSNGTFSRRAYPRLVAISLGLAAGFLLPFALIRNRGLLLYDPVKMSGIFRGSGDASLHPVAFVRSVGQTLRDLFIRGNSYQVDLPHPEFGTALSWLTLVVVFYYIFKKVFCCVRMGSFRKRDICGDPQFQIFVFAAILTGTFLIFSHISPNLPGIRRSAGMLIGFYLIYYLALKNLTVRPNLRKLKIMATLLLAVLPASHLFQLYNNISALSAKTREAYPVWLQKENSASASLERLYAETIAGKPLQLRGLGGGRQYSAPYAALQLLHRGKAESAEKYPVYASDPVTRNIIPVDLDLWRSYYWNH